MKNIYLITDYKGYFGSKYDAFPYRSGFDKNLLSMLFKQKGYESVFVDPSLNGFDLKEFKDKIVLFTSQEDDGLHYKSFLEDLVYSMELAGAKVIPSFILLRAHENKVFFEMLRQISGLCEINNFKSGWFGTLEEFRQTSNNFVYPLVIKSYHGSKSRKVFLVNTENEAIRQVRKITKTLNLFLKCRDEVRYIRHKGYMKDSWNRKKFIVQEFIPGLINDYKILIFGKKYYVLLRGNKKGDFRASGQGNLAFVKELPEGLLDFSQKCFEAFDTPLASFDIGFNGSEYFLFEAQFVYFGTYTLEYSDYYFTRESNSWKCVNSKSIIEEEFVNSITEFIL